MNVKQLSLFIENKPGQLLMPCEVLAKAGINMLLLALADTARFGILRIVVRDWMRAKEVLEKAGCVVNITDVVAVRVASKPGGLAGVLRAIDDAKINVEYMYAFTGQKGDAGLLLFRFADTEAAIRTLASKGVEMLDGETLEKLIES
jgi:hypothetical protein